MKNKQLNDEEKRALVKLKELAKRIQYHNKLYHEKDKPKIPDNKFDEYIKENNFLEKKFPHLILRNSPNKKVAGQALKKFSKSIHKLPMLSLANAFNKNDLREFIERLRKFLNLNSSAIIEFINEPKIDGLSINLLYKKGFLIKASTRGDGTEGENVTKNILTIKDIPHKLKGINIPNEIRVEITYNIEERQVIYNDYIFSKFLEYGSFGSVFKYVPKRKDRGISGIAIKVILSTNDDAEVNFRLIPELEVSKNSNESECQIINSYNLKLEHPDYEIVENKNNFYIYQEKEYNIYLTMYVCL